MTENENESPSTALPAQTPPQPPRPDCSLGLLEFRRADPLPGEADDEADSPTSRVLSRPRPSVWDRR
ncbi:MAG: hypothetical protein K2H88_00455 [Duncaniella sp.]|nr:hypothetical protein [Duncaniella sp.]MDE5918337.1 hypothetical protein [Duncaniella sp.]MDE6328623.1 hypothetical protein [Duncaniella sp.]MDE6358948.1 hypothetical protein [Duncaniella sp.]MDE6466316.1 hypothetical protein [Duncaniella sp.]